jgi:hypothetical protein
MTRARELAELATAYDSGGSLGFRNRIINGDFRIDQRNAGASVTINTSTAGTYSVDRFNGYCQQASGAYTMQQVATVPTLANGAFTNSLKFTVTNTTAAGSTNRVLFRQIIEGYNVADLGWGSSSATSITLSFWVNSSVVGTYGVGFINSAENRSYVGTYAVNSANTWEFKTITVQGDTSGTWLTNNSNGIRVAFDLGSGSNYNAASASTWVAQEACRTSGCVSWQQNSGATFYITGVQLEKGSTATSFDYRPYGTEELLCKRYYTKFVSLGASYVGIGVGVAESSTSSSIVVKYPVTMRAAPTAGQSSTGFYDGSAIRAVTSLSTNYQGNDALNMNITASGGGLTVGRASTFITNGSTGYFELNAEL